MKQSLKTVLSLLPVLSLPLCLSAAHIERDGYVEFEAESFAKQTEDSVRKWYIIDETTPKFDFRDDDGNHAASASGKAYIEILPDTRTKHEEQLIDGVNFSRKPGTLGVLSYPIEFTTTGTYYVWISAFSSNYEDNGLHVGIDGIWPESSQRMQWCEGKNEWTWSSAQRVEHNHCGYEKTITLKIEKPGIHDFQISMREDGVELDRIILVNDKNFEPEGYVAANPDLPFLSHVLDNGSIRLEFKEYDLTGSNPFYRDYKSNAYAVDAANEAYRKGFAKAQTEFEGPAGTYKMSLKTLTEIDGESTYKISVNGKELGQYQNKETETDYRPNFFKIENVALKPGDIISVESCPHTNGKIPEGDSTAWSRGRWQTLTLIPEGVKGGGH